MLLTNELFELLASTLDVKLYVSDTKRLVVKEGKVIVPREALSVQKLFLSFIGLAWSKNCIRLDPPPHFRSEYPGSDDFIGKVWRVSVTAYLSDKLNLDSIIKGYWYEYEIYTSLIMGFTPLETLEEYFSPVYDYFCQKGEGSGEDDGDNDGDGSDEGLEEFSLKEIMEEAEQMVGMGGDSELQEVVISSPIDKFRTFLSLIIDRRKRFEIDNLKHYNRNSRGSRDLMYTSVKKKVKTGQVKLGILLDVSGSIPFEVVTQAISTVQSLVNLLDRSSKVVAWDECHQGEWSLYNSPERLECGGGTRLASGLKYIAGLDFKHIVVFSDFDMMDAPEFVSEANGLLKSGVKVDFYYSGSPKAFNKVSHDLSYFDLNMKVFDLYKKVNGLGKSSTPSI